MGRRALVAREGPEEEYDLWYVHWFGSASTDPLDDSGAITDDPPTQLVERITADLGIDPRSGAFVEDDRSSACVEDDDRSSGPFDRSGHPLPCEPIADGTSLRRALREYLDPVVHETFVLVPREGEIRSHVVVPLWLPGDDPPDPPRAALVETDADIERVRGWTQGVREATAVAIDRGSLARAEAITLLINTLADRDAFVVPEDLP